MSESQRYWVFTGAFFVLLLSTNMILGGLAGTSLPFYLVVLISPIAGGIGFFLHRMISGGVAHVMTVGYTGSNSAEKFPSLSQARAFISREEWDKAHAELDLQWEKFPGDGDVLREYERLFQALHAPTGLAEHLQNALSVTKGEDLAFALLRLAELYAGVLEDRVRAESYCRRLVREFPQSPHARTGGELLAVLERERPPEGIN